jgi:hypothetical protein
MQLHSLLGRHGIRIPFASMVTYILKYWIFTWMCMTFYILWLRFVYLFHMRVDVLNVLYL